MPDEKHSALGSVLPPVAGPWRSKAICRSAEMIFLPSRFRLLFAHDFFRKSLRFFRNRASAAHWETGNMSVSGGISGAF
jgi:hypothetical protein